MVDITSEKGSISVSMVSVVLEMESLLLSSKAQSYNKRKENQHFFSSSIRGGFVE